MNFDTLLQYAKLDSDIEQVIKDYNATPGVKEYKGALKASEQFKVEVSQLKASFSDKQKQLAKLTEELSEIGIEITDSENQESNYSSSTQLEYPIKHLNDLLKRLDEIESTIKKLKADISSIDKDMNNCKNKGVNINITMKTYSNAYNEALSKMKHDRDELRNKKLELEAQIDPKILEHYKSQIEEKKANAEKQPNKNNTITVIYEHTPGVAMCPACYKHMGHEIDKLQGQGDYIFCPECGAILIIK